MASPDRLSWWPTETRYRALPVQDRVDAGERLGAALRERGISADIALPIPRGGLPVGRAVADALAAPFDVLIVKKIGAPGNAEFAIGAVAVDGTVWRNEEAIEQSGADDAYFDRKRRDALDAAREKAQRYRRTGPSELAGKSVIIVDDGVATGSTALAAIEVTGSAHPARLIFAVSVGPPDSIATLETMVDDGVCLETPESFRGVAQFHENFDQISDEYATSCLYPGE